MFNKDLHEITNTKDMETFFVDTKEKKVAWSCSTQEKEKQRTEKSGGNQFLPYVPSVITRT